MNVQSSSNLDQTGLKKTNTVNQPTVSDFNNTNKATKKTVAATDGPAWSGTRMQGSVSNTSADPWSCMVRPASPGSQMQGPERAGSTSISKENRVFFNTQPRNTSEKSVFIGASGSTAVGVPNASSIFAALSGALAGAKAGNSNTSFRPTQVQVLGPAWSGPTMQGPASESTASSGPASSGSRPRVQGQKSKNKVVSITYEEIGLFPRSFSRVFDRFFKQIFSDVENLVIQEYRFYRYLFLTTIKTLCILFFVPLAVNFIAKTYLIRPITEYYWNTQQTEIFLNFYEQKRAFAELHNFEEKLYFELFLEASNNKSLLISKNAIIAPSLIADVLANSTNFQNVRQTPFQNILATSTTSIETKAYSQNLRAEWSPLHPRGALAPAKAGRGSRTTTMQRVQRNLRNQTVSNRSDLSAATTPDSSFFSTGFRKQSDVASTSGQADPKNSLTNPNLKTYQMNLKEEKCALTGACIVGAAGSPALAGAKAPPTMQGVDNSGASITRSANRGAAWSPALAGAKAPPTMQGANKNPSLDKTAARSPFLTGTAIEVESLAYSVNQIEASNYETSTVTLPAGEQTAQSMVTNLQDKILELAIRYNNHSIEAISNFFADFLSLISLLYLLVSLEIQINITKSFLLEVFFGLDDSKKSLLILIMTDLLVGYHSSNLWELFFQFIFNHYGIPESQTGIFLLVATLPVLLDVLFKYLIFRHLNRSSPATVATYHAIIE